MSEKSYYSTNNGTIHSSQKSEQSSPDLKSGVRYDQNRDLCLRENYEKRSSNPCRNNLLKIQRKIVKSGPCERVASHARSDRHRIIRAHLNIFYPWILPVDPSVE